MSNIMEMIKLEWEDIRHSRNQEWRNLTIIGGIVWVFTQMKCAPESVKLTILYGGVIACLLSIILSIRHWVLFKCKVEITKKLEGVIGITLPDISNSIICVQGIIVLFYFLLLSGFVGAICWIKNGDMNCKCQIIIVLIVGLFTYLLLQLAIIKRLTSKYTAGQLDTIYIPENDQTRNSK